MAKTGVYNLITNDKNILLTPKIQITQKDIDDIEPLRTLRVAIDDLKKQADAATGKRKYLLKKQIIEMCQNQYLIKSDFRSSASAATTAKSVVKADLREHITINKVTGEPESDRPYLIL